MDGRAPLVASLGKTLPSVYSRYRMQGMRTNATSTETERTQAFMANNDNGHGYEGDRPEGQDASQTGGTQWGQAAPEQANGTQWGQTAPGQPAGYQGGQPAYGQPNSDLYASYPDAGAEANSFDQYPVDQKPNGIALWAGIFGIVSLVLTLSLLGLVIAWIPGIVAIVLGIIGLKKTKNYPEGKKRKGWAIAGLVLGFLTIIGAVLVTVFTIWLGGDCWSLLSDNAAFEQCIEDRTGTAVEAQ